MTEVYLFSSAQQQANLIPGLNLNALGIFSSGLPALPPAAGPRGAVPPVAPGGYNPFLVSALLLFLTDYPCAHLQKVRGWGRGDVKNASFRMTLPGLVLHARRSDAQLLQGLVLT